MPLCLEGGLNYISLYCVRKVPSLIGKKTKLHSKVNCKTPLTCTCNVQRGPIYNKLKGVWVGSVCHKVHFSCVERGPPSQKSALSDFKKILPINDVKTFHLILFKVNVKF